MTPVSAQIKADAVAASLDSNTRFAAGDVSVAGPEAAAVAALYEALKASGVRNPLSEWLDRLPGTVNFRTGA